jgi:hypothetical protein
MRNLIDIKWVSHYKLDHWIGLHFWIWNQASQEGIILWLYMYMMSWLERFLLLGSHMKIQINAKIQVWRIKLNSSGFIHHSHSRNFPTTTTNIWQIARASFSSNKHSTWYYGCEYFLPQVLFFAKSVCALTKGYAPLES